MADPARPTASLKLFNLTVASRHRLSTGSQVVDLLILRSYAATPQSVPLSLSACEFLTSSAFSTPPRRTLSIRMSHVILSPPVKIEESGCCGRAQTTLAPTFAVPA